MFILFLIGLFCLLLVIGFFVAGGGQDSVSFAVKAMVALAALAFVGFIGVMAWALLFSH